MSNSSAAYSRLPAILQWTAPGRMLVFVLAAASIWCLLSEMYGLCDMRMFFYFILLPATVLLYGIAGLDDFRGDRRVWRAVMIGTLAGLVGAVAYDMFRLPFVFSDAWGLGRFGIPQMPLFKPFPRFGALILGQPVEQSTYSLAAQILGWAYHFSNGATFGVMFAAMYAGAKEAFGAPHVGEFLPGLSRVEVRNSHQPAPPQEGVTNILPAIAWATLMAVGIEICLLVSPYTTFFGIPLTTRFIIVTLTAHIIFGIALGAYFAAHAKRWRLSYLN